MKTTLVVLILIGSTAVGFAQSRDVIQQLKLRDPVSTTPDRGIHEVVQTVDDRGFPSGYHMKLLTDVCEDKVCKILSVTLYWDAMGRYVRLETPSNAPLTKHDHIEFSADDYRKLDQILRDEGSVLNRYAIEDIMGDKDLELDAVSGATPLAVQGGVVQGAAYTTWVLWHWVHGEITEQLLQITKDSSCSDFIRQCLESEDQTQVEYALAFIGQDSRFWESVCEALDQMDYGNVLRAVQYLGQVDETRLAELIGRTSQRASEQIVKFFSKQSPVLNSEVLDILASRLPQMSYYELYTSLSLFDENEFSSETIRRNMSSLTNSPNPFIARRAKEYFQTTRR